MNRNIESKLGSVIHETAIAKPTVEPAGVIVDAEVLDDDVGLG
jgi:hypothetical protein